MGLDASVMCNCYRQGEATPCPFPEHFSVDADGFPALNLLYEYNEDKFDAFDTWLATCCDHPNMDYAAVFVGELERVSIIFSGARTGRLGTFPHASRRTAGR